MNSQRRHTRAGEFHHDLLGLDAKELHFRDIVTSLEPFLHIFRVTTQFFVRKTRTAQCQEHTIGLPEMVDNLRRSGPFGKEPLSIVNPLPQVVPDLGHGLGRVGILYVHEHSGNIGLAHGAHMFEAAQFLDRLFNHFGDLKFHLLGRCSRVLGDHHRRLNSKGWVFELAHIEIGRYAPQHNEKGEDHHRCFISNGPLCDIHIAELSV